LHPRRILFKQIKQQTLFKFFKLFSGRLVGNSFWAILSSVFQSIIFSLFFIVIARRYSSSDFSSYIIANTLYGMILSFSSLGLSQWFIREIQHHNFEGEIISRFFKIQLLAGTVFYLINVLLSFTLYSSDLIRNISLLLGINIIFDNIIYVFKTINISRYEQKRSFVLTSLEALIKLVLAAFVVYVDINIFSVIVMLVVFRGFTLYLFFRFGLSGNMDIAYYWKGSLDLREIGLVLKKIFILSLLAVFPLFIGQLVVCLFQNYFNWTWLQIMKSPLNYFRWQRSYLLWSLHRSSLFWLKREKQI